MGNVLIKDTTSNFAPINQGVHCEVVAGGCYVQAYNHVYPDLSYYATNGTIRQYVDGKILSKDAVAELYEYVSLHHVSIAAFYNYTNFETARSMSAPIRWLDNVDAFVYEFPKNKKVLYDTMPITHLWWFMEKNKAYVPRALIYVSGKGETHSNLQQKLDEISSQCNRQGYKSYNFLKVLYSPDNLQSNLSIIKAACGLDKYKALVKYIARLGLYEDIVAFQQKGVHVYVMGYSLGGGIVSALAERLAKGSEKYPLNLSAVTFYTFGSIYVPKKATTGPVNIHHYMRPNDIALDCSKVSGRRSQTNLTWLNEPGDAQVVKDRARRWEIHAQYGPIMLDIIKQHANTCHIGGGELTVRVLREMCAARGIRVPARMRKADILALLRR